MANTIEIILQAIDKASDIIRGVEQKTTVANEAMAKSFEGVGIASDAVDKRLQELGASVTGAARVQNELKQAQIGAAEAAQKLAQAQQNLKDNTDPSKVSVLNKELVNAQVQLDKAGKEVQDLSKALRDGGDAAKGGAQGFESFSGKLVAIQAGIGVAKEALAGLKQVWDFAKEGAENQRIAESFNRTAKSIGGNADDIIKRLDAAARGTVDDEELMQASTRALTLGVAKSGDDLVKVMQLSRAAALQFGGDAGQAFESINQAIGNLAPRALKQYGIIVNLGEANKKYADAIGTTVDALTEEQQRQALLNEVLVQGAKNFGDVGTMATTTSEKMKAVETRLANILDIFKEIAATGIGTALDIGDAPANIMAAFNDVAAKMRKEVAEGRMSVKDYNDALDGMAQGLRDSGFVMRQVDLDAAKLGKEFEDSAKGAYGLAGALDESARAARRAADAQAAEAAQQSQAKDAAQKHTAIMREYSAQLLANVEAYQRTKINLADTTTLAIAYTEAQQEQADVQEKLDKLNQQISSHGAARAVTVKNEKLSTEELAKTQAELAVAREDLAGVTKKEGETAAEFALRVETLKGKVAEYSQKLGEHTAVVGGATKAELEQKAALEGQIAALTKTEEIGRAKAAFESLTEAFRSGALTEGQYQERSAALNQVAGLYTDAALKQATAQEVLMKSFADPRSETWRGQLLLNEKALDGQIEKTGKLADSNKTVVDALSKTGVIPPIEVSLTPKSDKATQDAFTTTAQGYANNAAVQVPLTPKTDKDSQAAFQKSAEGYITHPVEVPVAIKPGSEQAVRESIGRAGIPIEIPLTPKLAPDSKEAIQKEAQGYFPGGIEVPIKPKIDPTDTSKLGHDLAGDVKFAPTITPKVDTTQATKDLQAYTTDQIGAVPATKKTTAIFDTYKATQDTNSILKLFGTIPAVKKTEVNVEGKAALQVLDDIRLDLDRIYSKTIEVIIKYKTVGEPPPGFQSGIDMIVPPSPQGRTGDYFPFLAAAGERVTVQTPAQQAQNVTTPRGDTYNYTTNVYNPLAAAMLADKQRRERIARSNSRMGVT